MSLWASSLHLSVLNESYRFTFQISVDTFRKGVALELNGSLSNNCFSSLVGLLFGCCWLHMLDGQGSYRGLLGSYCRFCAWQKRLRWPVVHGLGRRKVHSSRAHNSIYHVLVHESKRTGTPPEQSNRENQSLPCTRCHVGDIFRLFRNFDWSVCWVSGPYAQVCERI